MLNKFKFFKIALMVFLPAISFAKNIPLKVPGVLNVISYSEFKPISYGHGEGYEADLLKAVANLWHVKIKFHPEPVFDGLWRLPSRPYTVADVSMGGFTPSNYRIKEGSLFSIRTTSFYQSLLIRKKDYQSGRITSYKSFKNPKLKIGVVPGTTGEQFAHTRAKENKLPDTVFVQYAGESELLPALQSGKIDAIARGEIGNEYQASKNKELMVIDKKNFCESFTYAIDKSNKILENQLNKAIRKVTDNGKITYLQWLKHHDVFLKRVHQIRS